MTIEDLKLLEEGELEDHLMGIPEVMDPQAMEDAPQEEVHPKEEDLQDHQEEDHLVHLEILDPQEIKDPQVPLDLEDIEDPQAHKDLPVGPPGPQGPTCRTTRFTRTKSWTTLVYLEINPHHR